MMMSLVELKMLQAVKPKEVISMAKAALALELTSGGFTHAPQRLATDYSLKINLRYYKYSMYSIHSLNIEMVGLDIRHHLCRNEIGEKTGMMQRSCQICQILADER